MSKMSWYRHKNKRLVPRGGNGQFRKTTLEDIGLACCENCGEVFRPALPVGEFVDPREYRMARRFCDTCKKESGK